MLTDTGYVSDRMAGIIENADGYLIESIMMLKSLEQVHILGQPSNVSSLIKVTCVMKMERML